MDTLANIQKRKRADIVQNEHAIENNAEEESTIIVDTSHYGKPSKIEDNPEDSDVDQPNHEPLTKSTLFWSSQLIISRREEDELSLERPSTKHQIQFTPATLCKIFIILLSSHLN
jgi:hypothetical protein